MQLVLDSMPRQLRGNRMAHPGIYCTSIISLIAISALASCKPPAQLGPGIPLANCPLTTMRILGKQPLCHLPPLAFGKWHPWQPTWHPSVRCPESDDSIECTSSISTPYGIPLLQPVKDASLAGTMGRTAPSSRLGSQSTTA